MTRDAANDKNHEASLAFFGAVTASVSHELNNVLSIVDQSAGLLGDLVAGHKAGRPLPVQKLEQIAESMQRQTERGLEIIRRLNRFSHSADLDLPACDIGATVTNFSLLCRRWADMKRATVRVGSVPPGLMVSANPFQIQHWLYRAVTLLLTAAGPGTEIALETETIGRETLIRATGSALIPGTGPQEWSKENLGALVENGRSHYEYHDAVGRFNLALNTK